MKTKEMDVFFKKVPTYSSKEEERSATFFLYTKAVEEYCKHYYSLCKYAEDIGAGVIMQANELDKAAELMEAMNTACNYMCKFKAKLLNKGESEITPVDFFDKELGEVFCFAGKNAYLVEGDLVNAENIDPVKIKKIRTNVTPKLLDAYEYTTYINTIQQATNKEV